MFKRFKLRTLLILYIAIIGTIGLSITTYWNYKKERSNFVTGFYLAKDVEITTHHCQECNFFYNSGKGGRPYCKYQNEASIILWNSKMKGARSGVTAFKRWYYPAKVWIFIKDVLGIDLEESK